MQPSPPLSHLLLATAEAVAAVRAGRSLDAALAAVPPGLRPGTQALAYTVLRRLGGATAARQRLTRTTPPAPVDALLCSAIALLWPHAAPAYPDHTLVDQAVAAAKQRFAHAARFINAVLRRFVREREALAADVNRQPTAAFNHPLWWIERLRHDWPDQWQAVLRQAQQPPPLSLRVNLRRLTVADYLARAQAAGLAARPFAPTAAAPGAGSGLENAIVVEPPCPIERLPGFAQGDVSVQDAHAQCAAPLLLGNGLPARARVLDACAAPGGKTAHLLELADLDVLALDADAARLARVDQTLRRLGLTARTQAADALRPQAWWDGRPFDAILLDAPCSASGIVRRHPDIRWLRRAADIAALARTQAALLDALWPLLKPGGQLLYATCSVFRAEGSAQIDAFLQRQRLIPPVLEPSSPGHLLGVPDNRHDRLGASLGDGFFYALLRKPEVERGGA